MLVLSRKLGEKIKCGNEVEIEVVGLTGYSVRLGINAPDRVRILRGELAEREGENDVKTEN